MKPFPAALALMTAMCFVPAWAGAATELVSAPVKGGAGGVVCACTNLTEDFITVSFSLTHQTGGNSCTNQTITPFGGVKQCHIVSTLVRNCGVRRVDGKPALAKDLACSLAALDAAGNVTALVPVDKKVSGQ